MFAHQSGFSCLGTNPFSRDFAMFVVRLSTKKNIHEKISS